MDLNVDFAGIKLKNPLVGASGTFGYGLTYEKFFDLSLIGGFCTKGLSMKPREGNPTPRICETPSGMLNAIGLQNVGYEKFATKKMPKLRKISTAVIANFFGETMEEYIELAAKLDALEGIHGLEMNISCPNVEKGGAAFGTDIRVTEAVVKGCRAVVKNKPLIVKLSPNVADIAEFARACEGSGADGLSVINTLVGMAIDIKNRKPILANVTGGLSGPAIRPVAVRMVWQCYKAVKIPIFGIGGVASAKDVVEFIMAGASAVQVGTMNFVSPDIIPQLAEELPELLVRLGAASVSELVGVAHGG
ncbi:MAG: dihydroorotate dehydrogenase [Nitrospinota bacterium]|nr:dihydroorotate dehydrogenase [Nitrospinota bacterium]MDH5677398.1 dihydroorotate dehydrogenase [Nitrospinota bacterium]MDH5755352.1 dihydroorotate dehydrogenase [Nitrospinota bacterium]